VVGAEEGEGGGVAKQVKEAEMFTMVEGVNWRGPL